ncbi:hypothetical protein GGF50DRAFT_121569 [Schizophyllum commune]
MVDLSDVVQAVLPVVRATISAIAHLFGTLRNIVLLLITTFREGAATVPPELEIQVRELGLCREFDSLLDILHTSMDGDTPCTIYWKDIVATAPSIMRRLGSAVLYDLKQAFNFAVGLLHQAADYIAEHKLLWWLLFLFVAYLLARPLRYMILRLFGFTRTGVRHGVIAGLILTPILGPAVLGAVGFTTGGVAAGSAAAALHATIGNVVAGSAFAGAQAAGATGVIPTIGVAIGGLVGGLFF